MYSSKRLATRAQGRTSGKLQININVGENMSPIILLTGFLEMLM